MQNNPYNPKKALWSLLSDADKKLFNKWQRHRHLDAETDQPRLMKLSMTLTNTPQTIMNTPRPVDPARTATRRHHPRSGPATERRSG